ncbi:hypothetical protein [Ralstonia solanacearum]|uniref:hypothetical protein n=1 Tax=Ralstonia solanacearum TaxID=305 RepID=UPI001E376427|nr:hypothetical protein [Ralstonia solanacearum]
MMAQTCGDFTKAAGKSLVQTSALSLSLYSDGGRKLLSFRSNGKNSAVDVVSIFEQYSFENEKEFIFLYFLNIRKLIDISGAIYFKCQLLLRRSILMAHSNERVVSAATPMNSHMNL